MSFLATFNRTVGRRYSTLFLTVAVGTFVFDLTVNRATDAFWDWNNQGKQWKDIKKQLQAADE